MVRGNKVLSIALVVVLLAISGLIITVQSKPSESVQGAHVAQGTDLQNSNIFPDSQAEVRGASTDTTDAPELQSTSSNSQPTNVRGSTSATPTNTNTQTTRPAPSSTPLPSSPTTVQPAEPTTPTVSISANGCVVTATSASGYTLVYGAEDGARGVSDTLVVPSSGYTSISTGAARGWVSFGKLQDSSGQVVASTSKPVSVDLCT